MLSICDYLFFSYREYAVDGVHSAQLKLVCLFCFCQLVRVIYEHIDSKSNHMEGLWQAVGRHRSQI